MKENLTEFCDKLAGKDIEILPIGKQGYIVFSDNMDGNFGVPFLPDESVALVFTSPPYWDFIDYDGGNGVGNKESCYNDYLNSLQILFEECFKKIFPGGKMIINISNMKSRLSVEGKSFIYPIVSDVINKSNLAGFVFFDEIVWDKSIAKTGALKGQFLFGSYPYPPTPKILDSIFENILVFVKPGKRPKVPQDIKDKSVLTKQEWKIFTRGIWDIRTDSDPNHPATFPVELAERVIRMYSFVDDIVLDPYVGTGTTVIASELWDRQGIGFEISKSYKRSILNRKHTFLNVQLTL